MKLWRGWIHMPKTEKYVTHFPFFGTYSALTPVTNKQYYSLLIAFLHIFIQSGNVNIVAQACLISDSHGSLCIHRTSKTIAQ